MNIFIGMKVPRRDAQLRQSANVLTSTVSACGHTAFLATDEIARRGLKDPREFMPFVRQQIESTDLVILLYHPELRGGLIEAGIAYAHKIPIWLCHQPTERASSSMRGCADMTIEYDDLDDLRKKLSERLDQNNRETRH